MLFDSLDAVNGEDMLNASIYSTRFLPDEWGGANDSICSQAAFLASWGASPAGTNKACITIRRALPLTL